MFVALPDAYSFIADVSGPLPMNEMDNNKGENKGIYAYNLTLVRILKLKVIPATLRVPQES